MMTLHTENERALRRTLLTRCAATFLAISACYLLVRLTNAESGTVQIFAGLCLIACMLFFSPFFVRERDGSVSLAKALLYAGIILRVAYMLYTPWYVRVHDVEKAELEATGGGAYLLNLLLEHRLPPTNEWQFYQQPLYFLVCAPISWLFNAIMGTGDQLDKLVEAAKTVSCFSACASLYAADMLFDLCGLKGRGKCMSVAAAAFLPAAIISAGTIGADTTAAFMMELILIGTLLWYRCPDMKYTVALAIICGLGVLTKISCAAITLFTAAVMLRVFIRSREKGRMLGKYALFGAISLPLGLWYGVRNYILFGQPLTYSPRLTVTNSLYCGNKSFVSRFLLIHWEELLRTPYANPRQLFNLPVYLVKSALFGEFSFVNVPIVISCAILALGYALAVYSICLIIRSLRRRGTIDWIFGMLCLMFALLAAYYFYEYPFGCSQDYRYYEITGIFVAVLLGASQMTEQPDKPRGSLLPVLMALFVPCVTVFFMTI